MAYKMTWWQDLLIRTGPVGALMLRHSGSGRSVVGKEARLLSLWLVRTRGRRARPTAADSNSRWPAR